MLNLIRRLTSRALMRLASFQSLQRSCRGEHLSPTDIHTEGIQGLSRQDFRNASEFGYTIKLMASASFSDQGIAAWVAPTLVSNEHPLSHVSGVKNAVYITGDPIGYACLEGYGAGGDATAASLASDLMNAAAHIVKGGISSRCQRVRLRSGTCPSNR